jgi:hypothetical protein
LYVPRGNARPMRVVTNFTEADLGPRAAMTSVLEKAGVKREVEVHAPLYGAEISPRKMDSATQKRCTMGSIRA